MTATRPAAVAGTFYPADPQALRNALAGHLASAATVSAPSSTDAAATPKMLVVPHAGYVYSGDVAAQAYATLAPWRKRITRVVLLGPVHRVAVRGLAAPTVSAFDTPLGRVPLDTTALAELEDLPQVVRSDLPHAQEHSLEVQLPFLQTVLGTGFQLIPLAVGNASPSEVAEVLERLWGGEETLIVISSDLSHYLPYAQAHVRDQATVQRILHFASNLHGEEACGAAPLNGALQVARQHGLTPRLLCLRNSGDAIGDHGRVVGYAAMDFVADLPVQHTPPGSTQEAPLGPTLVQLARNTIAQALGLPAEHTSTVPDLPALREPGATFVTLHDADGALRGCIGRLEACRPLGEDVRANAHAAAFQDPRFTPVRADEWPGIQVEVSLLDVPVPMAVHNETEALAALHPGIDGVILEWRGHRATFLPQVWEQLPDAVGFMAALKRKAGLAPDFWAPDVRLSRYSVRCYKEPIHGVTP